jgi:hypothetical protein
VGEQHVVIEDRYCGPSESGNGGYVCGLLARLLDRPAQVTLRRPPPIGRPLDVRQTAEGGVSLLDAGEVVAEAVPARLEVDPPVPVSLAEAAEASRGYPGFTAHPFPTCFVCGPRRAQGDGLRIFPGPVTGRQMVAAPWTPDPTLRGDGDLIRQEFVWAALDCPGAFASGFPETPMVLGRLAAHLQRRPVRAGQACVVVGWPEGSEGRKHFAGTAVFTGDGDLLAVARATWISVLASSS